MYCRFKSIPSCLLGSHPRRLPCWASSRADCWAARKLIFCFITAYTARNDMSKLRRSMSLNSETSKPSSRDLIQSLTRWGNSRCAFSQSCPVQSMSATSSSMHYIISQWMLLIFGCMARSNSALVLSVLVYFFWRSLKKRVISAEPDNQRHSDDQVAQTLNVSMGSLKGPDQ